MNICGKNTDAFIVRPTSFDEYFESITFFKAVDQLGLDCVNQAFRALFSMCLYTCPTGITYIFALFSTCTHASLMGWVSIERCVEFLFKNFLVDLKIKMNVIFFSLLCSWHSQSRPVLAGTGGPRYCTSERRPHFKWSSVHTWEKKDQRCFKKMKNYSWVVLSSVLLVLRMPAWSLRWALLRGTCFVLTSTALILPAGFKALLVREQVPIILQISAVVYIYIFVFILFLVRDYINLVCQIF